MHPDAAIVFNLMEVLILGREMSMVVDDVKTTLYDIFFILVLILILIIIMKFIRKSLHGRID